MTRAILAALLLAGCAAEPEGWTVECAGSCPGIVDLGPAPGMTVGQWQANERGKPVGPPTVHPGPRYEVGVVSHFDALDAEIHR